MLCNNLTRQRENPMHSLSTGLGKAARNWDCFDAIIRTPLDLETMKPRWCSVGQTRGVLTTPHSAPRVLIANANIKISLGQLGHFP